MLGDRVGGGAGVLHVRFASQPRRRVDGHEDELRALQAILVAGCEMQAAGPDVPLDHLFEPRLKDRDTAVAEETAARWVLDLLGLPPTASVGFTTGCQMARVVCLAAARRGVLLRAGWNVERQGLTGAPRVTVICGGEVHVTVPIALQLLGLGSDSIVRTAVDGQGRMDVESLRAELARVEGPVIVCAQAGNVNTGNFDPVDAIADAVAEHQGAWLHIDGAFGLWARVVPELAPLANGVERADSWATDGHKWLNVPYDCGIAIVREPSLHHDAVAQRAKLGRRCSGGGQRAFLL